MYQRSYDYFDGDDSVWWETFFNNQSDIISRTRNEDTCSKTPFTWPKNIPNEQEEIHIF